MYNIVYCVPSPEANRKYRLVLVVGNSTSLDSFYNCYSCDN